MSTLKNTASWLIYAVEGDSNNTAVGHGTADLLLLIGQAHNVIRLWPAHE